MSGIAYNPVRAHLSRRHAVKVSVALRALRRCAYLLYGIILWYTATGWYSAGFAVCAAVTVAAVWWMLRLIVVVTARRGKVWLDEWL